MINQESVNTNLFLTSGFALLEAINDFNSNDNLLWRGRIGAYNVEKSDTLKLIMSNRMNFNISVMDESREVPQLYSYCNNSDLVSVSNNL